MQELEQPAAAQQLVDQARQGLAAALADIAAAAAAGVVGCASSPEGGDATCGGRGCMAPACDHQRRCGAKAGKPPADRGAAPPPQQHGKRGAHNGKASAGSVRGAPAGAAAGPAEAAFAFKFF